MNIQPQSQIEYGDEEALRDFFFAHRLVHIQVDTAIVNAGGGSMPGAAIDSDHALEGWVAHMRKGLDPEHELSEKESYALTDWLHLHDTLHQSEYVALGLGQAPALAVVDFSNPEQFNDWMYAHSAVHDTLNLATGNV